MTNFKYATPYWRSSHEIYGEGVKSYTDTTLYILNYNEYRAIVKLYFYDLRGNYIPEIYIEMQLPGRATLDIRIQDYITQKYPNYINTSYLMNGSLKIVSDKPLVISGKMFNGITDSSRDSEDKNVWSIPFEEIELPDVKLERFDPNQPIPTPNPNFPRPFPR
jgi:hypothetical protein